MEAATATAPVVVRKPQESVAAKVGRYSAKLPFQILMIVIAAAWIVPTFGLLLTSLTPADVIDKQGWWKVVSHPSQITFANYDALFKNNDITSALTTTVEIAVLNTLILILIASLAGYAFAWIDFPGRDTLFIVVIGLLVVPLQVALIPIFSLYNTTGLFDTVLGLVLFHVAFGLPFAIFLLRNFFIGIPKDILESARIDGASELTIFFRLILPLGLPAIASLAIFQFLWTWNDLLVELTFGRNSQQMTVAIYSILRHFGSNIELIAPASFLSLIVPLAVFFAFQRYFVQGLLAGSVK